MPETENSTPSTEEKTFFLIDRDGVIAAGSRALDGIKEMCHGLVRSKLPFHFITNDPRYRSADIAAWISEKGEVEVTEDQVLTSGDATAHWFKKLMRELEEEQIRPFVIGEAGLHEAFATKGVKTFNAEWDGQKWKSGIRPSHVVVGYKRHDLHDQNGQESGVNTRFELDAAWNALDHGAELVGTNGDRHIVNEVGERIPHTGPMLDYFSSVATKKTIIGKPKRTMGEVALDRMGAEQGSARVIMIGDTVETDGGLALALSEVGWQVEMWLVGTGNSTSADLEKIEVETRKFFEDIRVLAHAELSD